ncbi:MAG: hypothetical protein CMK92_05340 [Pseudomonas sp.]|nr:hypothetical protein [Pseudomonas sp.]
MANIAAIGNINPERLGQVLEMYAQIEDARLDQPEIDQPGEENPENGDDVVIDVQNQPAGANIEIAAAAPQSPHVERAEGQTPSEFLQAAISASNRRHKSFKMDIMTLLTVVLATSAVVVLMISMNESVIKAQKPSGKDFRTVDVIPTEISMQPVNPNWNSGFRAYSMSFKESATQTTHEFRITCANDGHTTRDHQDSSVRVTCLPIQQALAPVGLGIYVESIIYPISPERITNEADIVETLPGFRSVYETTRGEFTTNNERLIYNDAVSSVEFKANSADHYNLIFCVMGWIMLTPVFAVIVKSSTGDGLFKIVTGSVVNFTLLIVAVIATVGLFQPQILM